ncbi:MAG: DUF2238 domain-containing protein [Steroidobacter sp.]
MIMLVLLVMSGLAPFDRTTWWLEIFPILIAVPLLILTHKTFPLTPLLCFLIFLHCIVLMVGGRYSYARVPLGFWIAELFDWHRNPYDKIGHFFQGFVPALVAREIFIRKSVIQDSKTLAFICVCVVMAISASYELIEWASALIMGQGADEFLGTQGDPWDTQSDMFMALVGAIVALMALSRLHDRQISRLPSVQAGSTSGVT